MSILRATPRRLDLSFDEGVRASSFFLAPTSSTGCNRPKGLQSAVSGRLRRRYSMVRSRIRTQIRAFRLACHRSTNAVDYYQFYELAFFCDHF